MAHQSDSDNHRIRFSVRSRKIQTAQAIDPTRASSLLLNGAQGHDKQNAISAHNQADMDMDFMKALQRGQAGSHHGAVGGITSMHHATGNMIFFTHPSGVLHDFHRG
jgi:hypothetical protein